MSQQEQQQQQPAFYVSPAQMKQIAKTRPAQLIEGFMPSSGVMVLAGAPGTGKSFTALSWAAAVAEGCQWFGHATRQAPVVYILGEGFSGFGDRIAGWEHAYKRPMSENLHFVDGLTFGIDLKDPETVQKLINALAYVQPGLVIFDTFSMLARVSNENDNAEVATVMANVNTIVQATGATALLVHHVTKSTGRVRGASAFVGNADTVVVAAEDERHDAPGDFFLSTATSKDGKQRDGEAKTLYGFSIEWPGVLHHDNGLTGTAHPDPNDPGTQDKALAAATEALDRYKDEHNTED